MYIDTRSKSEIEDFLNIFIKNIPADTKGILIGMYEIETGVQLYLATSLFIDDKQG